MDRSGMGRGQRVQPYLCTVVRVQEHEDQNIRDHLGSIVAPHRMAKNFSWSGSRRRIIACRRLLLQQLARRESSILRKRKSGQRPTV